MPTENSQSSQKIPAKKYPRGGLGNKGNPLAIKYSINEAVKDTQRTTHDIEKIRKDKDELLADLADLRIREKEANESKLSEEVSNLIKKHILNIQKKLNELNGTLPEVSLSDDQKKIQKIINEWNEGKKEKREAVSARAKAEALLAKDPSDRGAMGQANRASAAIYASTQEMERVFNEAQIIKKNFTHDPALDESVNIHTGEKEQREKSAVQRVSSVPEQEVPAKIPSVQVDKKNEITTEKLTIKDDPVRDGGISYTHKQSVFDQEKYHATHKPAPKALLIKKKQIVGKIPFKKGGGVVEKRIEQNHKNSPPQKKEPDYTEATRNLLLQMNRVLEKNKITNDSNPKNKADAPFFSLKPAEGHLLLNDKEHIPRSRFTSLKDTLRGSFIRQTEKQPIKENQIPFLAEKTLLHHIDILFGKKGFWGFGARAGITSPHWKDPVNGFAGKTIEDIFATHLPPARADGAQADPNNSKEDVSLCVGVKNYDAIIKMKKYLSQAFEQTKVAPIPKETVLDYLTRAITTIFDNYKNKK